MTETQQPSEDSPERHYTIFENGAVFNEEIQKTLPDSLSQLFHLNRIANALERIAEKVNR